MCWHLSSQCGTLPHLPCQPFASLWNIHNYVSLASNLSAFSNVHDTHSPIRAASQLMTVAYLRQRNWFVCSHAAIYGHGTSAHPVDKILDYVHAPSPSPMVENEHIFLVPTLSGYSEREKEKIKLNSLKYANFIFSCSILTCPFAHITCIKSSVILWSVGSVASNFLRKTIVVTPSFSNPPVACNSDFPPQNVSVRGVDRSRV